MVVRQRLRMMVPEVISDGIIAFKLVFGLWSVEHKQSGDPPSKAVAGSRE